MHSSFDLNRLKYYNTYYIYPNGIQFNQKFCDPNWTQFLFLYRDNEQRIMNQL